MSRPVLCVILLVAIAAEAHHCPKDEVPSDSAAVGCQNTCRHPLQSRHNKCAPKKGCVCPPKCLRNSKGVCVRAEKCESNDGYPGGCGGDPHAHLDPCGNDCELTCSNRDNPPVCIAVCRHVPACRCNRGYVRNLQGRCVKPKDCPRCKGPNEVYDCGSACDTECNYLGCACPIVNVKCTERCYCKKGYARNCKGVCIPLDKCPKMQFPCPLDPNAEHSPHPDPCPRTCENRRHPPKGCPAPCRDRGYRCKKGCVLRNDGKCVKEKHCPH